MFENRSPSTEAVQPIDTSRRAEIPRAMSALRLWMMRSFSVAALAGPSWLSVDGLFGRFQDFF